MTIKTSGQPPFGAQIILNGHEYVGPPSPGGGDSIHQGRQLLHRGRQPRGPGSDRRCPVAGCGCRRLSQVCRSWIYSACLCFALDLDRQRRSGVVYGFAVYQLECRRNLIFDGASDAADRRRRFYRVAALAAHAALLTLRDQVIASILAGIRSPRIGPKPKAWTRIDRDTNRSPSTCRPLRRPGPHDPGAASRLTIPTTCGPHRQRMVDRQSSSG